VKQDGVNAHHVSSVVNRPAITVNTVALSSANVDAGMMKKAPTVSASPAVNTTANNVQSVSSPGQGDAVPKQNVEEPIVATAAVKPTMACPPGGNKVYRANGTEANGNADTSVSSMGVSHSESFSKSASASASAPNKPAVNNQAHKEDGSISESFASLKSMAESDAASLRSIKSIRTDTGHGSMESLQSTEGGKRLSIANGTGASSNYGKWVQPPNVVVYCGNKDTARKFAHMKEALEQCLNTDVYTIYHIPHDDFMATPWETNSAVLIISHDYLFDK
jgi:hypothetical protein